MNLVAKISINDYFDLVVIDFEVVPAFPCGHPRTGENIYMYEDQRVAKIYKFCKRCRADRQLAWWRSKRDLRR